MLLRQVRDVIRREGLIDPEDRVLVCVSGGMDSSVLLFILIRLRDDFPFDVGVAHLNHGLRGTESLRDENFVQELAARFNLPFHTRSVDLRSYAKAEGLSLQHAGRDLRYSYFTELAGEHGYQKIALGHTRDDQVETFIMRIIKGTGLRGLSSISVRRGPIIRPLLFSYRSEVEAYLKKESIPHVEDSSNQKDIYQRNFIRNRVLPLFEKLNPNFRERVLFLLDDLTRLNRLFEQEADRFLNKEVRSGEGEVAASVEALKNLHPETRYRVLSAMIQRLEPTVVLLRDHLRLIEQALRSTRPNVNLSLPCGVIVSKSYESLIVTKKRPSSPIQGFFPVETGLNTLGPFGIILECAVAEGPPDKIPDGTSTAFFDYDKTSRLQVRAFLNGDRFVPLGMEKSVKLKDFFISRKVPLHRRRQIPLLLSGPDIIWVIGQRIDDRYKVTAGTHRVLRVSVRPIPSILSV